VTESEFQHLLQRYLDGACTPQEQAQVERWYDRLEQMQASRSSTPSQEAVEDAIWRRMAPRQQVALKEGRVINLGAAFWNAPQLRWAAALLLFAMGLGLLWWFGNRFQVRPVQTIAAAKGWTRRTNSTHHVQHFRLPDGSRITLKPGSSLRYAAAFAGPKREVYLVGEAFFQVSKNADRPFLVFTKQVVTTVLGTSFRVTDYLGGQKATVAVREGKVAVQAREEAQLDATPVHPADKGVLLLPNQQVVYSAASHHLTKELVEKPVVLKPQAFNFEERPVAEVLTALEKAYGVTIGYDKVKLADCTVSITFYDEPLFDKLDLLCKSLGAHYTVADAQVTIHSNGCQAR